MSVLDLIFGSGNSFQNPPNTPTMLPGLPQETDFRNSIMSELNPANDRKKAWARALLAASSAMSGAGGSSPLHQIAAGLNAGRGAYLDTQDARLGDRLKALQVFDAFDVNQQRLKNAQDFHEDDLAFRRDAETQRQADRDRRYGQQERRLEQYDRGLQIREKDADQRAQKDAQNAIAQGVRDKANQKATALRLINDMYRTLGLNKPYNIPAEDLPSRQDYYERYKRGVLQGFGVEDPTDTTGHDQTPDQTQGMTSAPDDQGGASPVPQIPSAAVPKTPYTKSNPARPITKHDYDMLPIGSVYWYEPEQRYKIKGDPRNAPQQ